MVCGFTFRALAVFWVPVNLEYSSTSLVRASVVRCPSVVRGFEWLNFSSLSAQRFHRMVLKFGNLTACINLNVFKSTGI